MNCEIEAYFALKSHHYSLLIKEAYMKVKQFSNDTTLAIKASEILDENKAENIALIDVSYLSNIADYFIIATANSTVHARALEGHIEDALEEIDAKVIRRDGTGDNRWIVLDFGSLIVHILTAEMREFYNIEKLWSDGKNTLNLVGIRKLAETPKEATASVEESTA